MYITAHDLTERYGVQEIGRLTQNIQNMGALDAAIGDACEAVDSYVAVRYSLPLAVVPISLKRACAVIARYYLYKDKPTDSVRRDYEDIIRWLEQIASGKAVLMPATDKDSAHYRTGIMVV